MVVIYSTRNGRVRRIISDSVRSDAKLEQLFPPVRGEASLRTSRVTIEDIQREVSDRTGLIPGNDRCAVVDSNGIARNFIMADHAIDTVEGGTLVAHADARIGWRQMRNGTWQRTLEEIDEEIAQYETKRDTIDSAATRDREAADPEGLTKEQIDAIVAASVVTLEALAIERSARLALR